MPPWDLWVALGAKPDHKDGNFESYLISWIPQPLLAIADAGIYVNPEECICWLENSPVAIPELRAYLA